MQDAWRAYLELALGLTEASKRKAEKVARDLFDKGGATAAQAQSFVEDLVATSRANREELTKLVRFEVERGLGRVGLATADEVSQLSARVRELERQLRATGVVSAAAAPTGPKATAEPVAKQPTPKKTTTKKTAAKKTTKKAVAKKTTAKPASAPTSTARKSTG